MSELSKETLVVSKAPKKEITGYWTKRAEDFAKLRQAELHSNKYLRWLKELTEQLPASKALRILDVGCGAGFFTIMLAHLGYQVTGIDLTAAMIEAAENLAETEQVASEFLVMDAEKLAFPTGSFDVVLARNVTWNLPHPEQAYGEWLRILKPGGLLLNYDAEYARDHHQQIPARHNAHEHLPPELLSECHHLYHILPISLETRPGWDQKVLQGLACSSCGVTRDVGRKIYQEEDQFYIGAPLFRIKAIK